MFNLTIDTSRMPNGWHVNEWVARLLTETALEMVADHTTDGELIYDPRTNEPPVGDWNLFGPTETGRSVPSLGTEQRSE